MKVCAMVVSLRDAAPARFFTCARSCRACAHAHTSRGGQQKQAHLAIYQWAQTRAACNAALPHPYAPLPHNSPFPHHPEATAAPHFRRNVTMNLSAGLEPAP